MTGHLAVVIAAFAIWGCTTTPSPSVAPTTTSAFDFPVDCGPIQDAAFCDKAVMVAATAKLNPPPISGVSIRRPRPGDHCTTGLHPCGQTAVVVVIQSGDTLQDVALLPSTDGWIRLDLIR